MLFHLKKILNPPYSDTHLFNLIFMIQPIQFTTIHLIDLEIALLLKDSIKLNTLCCNGTEKIHCL